LEENGNASPKPFIEKKTLKEWRTLFGISVNL